LVIAAVHLSRRTSRLDTADFMAIFSDEQTLARARARRKRDSIVEFHVGLDEFNIAPPLNKERAKIEVAFIRVIIIIITIAVRARGSRLRSISSRVDRLNVGDESLRVLANKIDMGIRCVINCVAD